VNEQAAKLGQKLQGHYAYYGITGNSASLRGFQLAVKRAWRYWLSRRRRDGALTWDAFNVLLEHHRLPEPRIVHGIKRLVANPS
jgi:hypothetical protein